jgi:hypothetical protein
MRKNTILFIAGLVFLFTPGLGETYTTWASLEIDKCATAWLLKRFIDKEAEFRFIPVGEMVKEGIPFDTPDSEIRRYHNRSAYETLLRKHKLEDPALEEIRQIVHDLEIAAWMTPTHPETEKLREEMVPILSDKKLTPAAALEKSFEVLDNYYKKLSNKAREDKK